LLHIPILVLKNQAVHSLLIINGVMMSNDEK
jgi:hypothetical protein